MNARHNVLGPGNRANATIGRALRLMAMNVLGAQARRARRELLRPPRQVHVLLRRGPAARAVAAAAPSSSATRRATTSVTLVPVEGARQIAQQLTGSRRGRPPHRRRARSARRDLFADRQGRPRRSSCSARSTPASASRRAGRSDEVREFLARESRITPAELAAAGVHIETRRPARHDPGRRWQAARRRPRPTTSCSSPRAARARAGRPGCPPGRRRSTPTAHAPRPPGGRAAARLRPRRLHRPRGEAMTRILVHRPDEPDAAAGGGRARAARARSSARRRPRLQRQAARGRAARRAVAARAPRAARRG